MTTPRDYNAVDLLKDGTSVRIRAIRPEDKPLVLEHFERMSNESIHLRYFGLRRGLSETELKQTTEPDFDKRVVIAAVEDDGRGERILALGCHAVVEEVPGGLAAEVAFDVNDADQGRGAGSLLLEHLTRLARAAGVVEFRAEVLGENNRMIRVFQNSGFKVVRAAREGIVHVRFPTEETGEHLEAARRRERLAAGESLKPLLRPASVAVVGASRRPMTIGQTLVRNLLDGGFTGPVYPVNPKAEEVLGLKCHPSVESIGKPVDLAIVAAPASAVEDALADCARAGVRGAVVISAGFAEVSPEGRELQNRLKDFVRGAGMRMIGPNCMGILNTDPAVRLNANFAAPMPPAGSIGIMSQSGALALAILDYVRKFNAGVSSFVSAGNKADVSGNDLLAFWENDPATKVILLYLESFGNPRKFAWLAPEVARAKPVVAVKSGRSAAGSRAASSHSAALASLDVAVDALFEQAGVVRADTLEELFDAAVFFAAQPPPAGSRTAVVTNGGGLGILFADACEARGIKLPSLAPETVAGLRTFLPAAAGLSNPVDMIASATAEQYERTIEAAGADPNVDSVAVIYIPPMVTRPEDIAAAIARGAGKVPPEKPVLVVFCSSQGAPESLHTGPRGALPVYAFPENAAKALAAAAKYSAWKARPRGEILRLDPFERSVVRAVIEKALEGKSGPVWAEPEDIAALLRAAGIEYAHLEVAAPDKAADVAERMGFPLVAKAVAPGIIHKSDIGGVIRDVRSREDAARAAETLRERAMAAGFELEGVLLQRQVEGGIEALAGVTTDPTFGPLVICGLGGVLVELIKDAAFHLTPVSDLDAAEMIGKLKAGRLLDGYRGAPAGDRAALIDVICRVSALIEAAPEIREMDLNPVKVLPPGKGAIAVDARMRLERV